MSYNQNDKMLALYTNCVEKSLLHLFCIDFFRQWFYYTFRMFSYFQFQKQQNLKKNKQRKNTKNPKQTNKSSIQQGTVLYPNKLWSPSRRRGSWQVCFNIQLCIFRDLNVICQVNSEGKNDTHSGKFINRKAHLSPWLRLANKIMFMKVSSDFFKVYFSLFSSASIFWIFSSINMRYVQKHDLQTGVLEINLR